MAQPTTASDDRDSFELQATDVLLGRSVMEVSYWDVHNFSDEPRTWDYGSWHHAVLGVGFRTDAGYACVLWTSRFYPYGVEVFSNRISEHFVEGSEGPESWSMTEHPLWAERTQQPIEQIRFFWLRMSVGPARLLSGEVVGGPQDYDVPVAVRLDFRAGPVWMVAGMPPSTPGAPVFIGGDEVLVVFEPEHMQSLGFPVDDFLAW